MLYEVITQVHRAHGVPDDLALLADRDAVLGVLAEALAARIRDHGLVVKHHPELDDPEQDQSYNFV